MESSAPPLLNSRIEYQNSYGTIKYIGPLKHTELPTEEIWAGIEWDDPTRGKHNGLVNNIQYFTTKNNQSNASLIKLDKLNFGIDVLEAILSKYFKENPSLLHSQIAESLKNDKKIENKENKEENPPKTPITVEYDEEAYFETTRKHKKKVEFYGFDRIWKKINNLSEILELSLEDMKISELCEPGFLGRLIPEINILSLEKNLLKDWNQIFFLGSELKNLKSLALSQNRLLDFESDGNKNNFEVQSKKTGVFIIEEPAFNVFNNLKTLILINMDLNWKSLNKVIKGFLMIEELILCKNRLNDFENLKLDCSLLENLKFLNLEENQIADFSTLNTFGVCKNLEKLILTKNYLNKIGKILGFTEIKTISLESNLLEDPIILRELSQFPSLTNLRLKENPFISVCGSSYIRQRAVAENKSIHTINGSILKKYERKDCEIFYLRNTFQEYFKIANKEDFNYDFNDFLEFCKFKHPRVPELIKIYGNPYEIVQNQVVSVENTQKSTHLMLKITALAGPSLGKESLKRKFPYTTTIQNLKTIFSKIFGIGNEKQIIYYKRTENDVMEIMDEDQKSLIYYSVANEGEILVDEKA